MRPMDKERRHCTRRKPGTSSRMTGGFAKGTGMRPQVSAACLTSRRLLHQKQRAQLQGERAIAARQAAPTFGRQAAFLQSLCLGSCVPPAASAVNLKVQAMGRRGQRLATSW